MYQVLIGLVRDPAYVGLIGALIGAVVSIVIFKVNRKRPNHIVCIQYPLAAFTSLQRITARLNHMRAEINFAGKQVAKPWIAILELTNTGSEVVSSLKIKISCNDSVFVDAYSYFVPERTEETVNIIKKNNKTWQFEIDYLNPVKDHDETLLIELLCDGEPSTIATTGGGLGWSIRYLPANWRDRVFARYAIYVIVVTFIAILFALVSITWAITKDNNLRIALGQLWSNHWIQYGILALVLGFIVDLILITVMGRKVRYSFLANIWYIVSSILGQIARGIRGKPM